MSKIIKITSSVILTVWLSVGAIFAWNGLTATTWDSLTATKWNEMLALTVPTWAVMPFDLQACPTGWTEYTAARGKFIRWADTGANNDLDFISRSGWTWARKIGSTQEWATLIPPMNISINIQASTDQATSVTPYNGSYLAETSPIRGSTVKSKIYTTVLWSSPVNLGWVNASITGGYNGVETRPMNVSLLYCKKN